MITKEDVKFAQPQDVAQLVALGFSSFFENDLQEVVGEEPNFNKAMLAMTEAVIQEVALVKRNDKDPKNIDACMVMVQDTVWWGDTNVLKTMLFFIKQEHRSYQLAKALLQAAQEYAIMTRQPIVFDLFAQKDVHRKKKLLKRLGFEELGSFFVYRV